MSARKFLLFSLLFLLSINVFAQTPSDAAKEKIARQTKLLDQIITEAKTFRLPENRAYVLARAASAYWQIDEKRGRKLFDEAISEIITAQTDAQNDKIAKQYLQALLYGQSPRMEIIALIGKRDAEFALESLVRSRPPAITEASKNPDDNSNSILQQYLRNEISIEQKLVALAADQNPQIAVKRLRESLKKGITYETLNLLKKIYAKEPETADKLAEELTETLINTDFSQNYITSEAVGNFVGDLGRVRAKDETGLKIPDELLRRLVSKMIDNWLNEKTNQIYGYWSSKTLVERLFPERAARVRQKTEQIRNTFQTEEVQEYSKLISSETTPEELLIRAEKFQPAYRNEIYRTAATKLIQNGNIAQAEKIIRTNITEDQAENYLSQFYTALTNQFANQEKFDEANNYANQIPDENQRINTLTNLAIAVYQKDTKENQKLAERILEQARALIPDVPENQNDFNAITYLATVYAPINPDEAFRLIESLLPSLNELIQANFLITRFRNYGAIRQGEIQVFNANTLGVYNLDGALRILAEKDFDRTLQFANGFSRAEMRIWYQLQMIDENSLSNINPSMNVRQSSKIDR